MKTITLALWLAASAYGVALASESRHAVIVDMPKVITMSHATPDTWHTLLPVQPNDKPTSTATSAFGDPVFGQVSRLQPKCRSTDVSRNGLSLLEFFDADHS
jgi:hypothetical protein